MEEPSVLDYVKAKLTFWKPSSITIPAPEPSAAQEAVEPPAANLDTEAPVTEQAGEAIFAVAATPESVRPAARLEEQVSGTGLLLTLGSLVMALIAQGFLEPPSRAVTAASITYAISGALIAAAFWRGVVLPARLPASETRSDTLRFHGEGLVVGTILMALTFLTFGTPKAANEPAHFGFINTALWLLSVGYLVWTFYLPPAGGLAGLRNQAARLITAGGWKITITRWTLLVLLVTAVVIFFRFYRLDSVPADMVSDHAEKLLDVSDVLNGQFRVFFPRNTGREAFQFFWTALMIKLFPVGVSFLALKLGTTLIGLLALYYMYRLGYEVGNRWVALYALLFCGFSYWAQTQARIALRFTLYPGFFAPVLFYMIRGLRTQSRNDFIWAGIWMGIGLHGYSPYRVVPLVIVAGMVIYLLHHRSTEERRFSLFGLAILALTSLAVLMPLVRFTFDRPDMVAFRSLTRVGTLERALPGSPVIIFLQNAWSALVMFFWDNGDVWVHSIVHRPALDLISAALFFLGVVLVLLRYIRRRSWVDVFLLVSIPLLMLPSTLSLAFPNENPILNRTAAAYVPAFLIVGIALDALAGALRRIGSKQFGAVLAALVVLILVGISASANFDLVFHQYDRSFRESSWNTAEMGAVVRQFSQSFGRGEDAWVIPFPYWVDTRLVGINAGYPTRDMALPVDQLPQTQADPRSKLFLLNPQDREDLDRLSALYPEGRYWLYASQTPGKDFVIFLVPPKENFLPQ